MPKVSIIIATWNSQKFLSDLFLSLRAMDYPKENWDLIVVDNNSQDNTIQILSQWQKKMFNFSKIITNQINRGFSAGNNQGIQYALKNNPDYIALLNDDVIVTPNWLKNIIKKMEDNPDVGLAQPLLTRYPETNKINSFGNCYHYTGFGYSFGESQKIKDFFTKGGSASGGKHPITNYEPAYLSFTAVIIRSAVIKQIGLLDENYFAYHEDTDFCFRARLNNWRLLATRDSIVHHHYKFPAHKNKIRYFWLEKNRLYLMLKFFKFKTVLLVFPAWLFMEFGLIFFSIIRGFFFQRLKAYFWILKNFAKIIKARRQIQHSRKFSDQKLFKFISAKIEFQEINNPLLNHIGNPILNLYFKIIKKFIY